MMELERLRHRNRQRMMANNRLLKLVAQVHARLLRVQAAAKRFAKRTPRPQRMFPPIPEHAEYLNYPMRKRKVNVINLTGNSTNSNSNARSKAPRRNKKIIQNFINLTK